MIIVEQELPLKVSQEAKQAYQKAGFLRVFKQLKVESGGCNGFERSSG